MLLIKLPTVSEAQAVLRTDIESSSNCLESSENSKESQLHDTVQHFITGPSDCSQSIASPSNPSYQQNYITQSEYANLQHQVNNFLSN